uniref:Uncharacterized protein n=1 Tax=Arundo donax TaxID=35708 RepID=A0A0A8XNP1_ARUDO
MVTAMLPLFLDQYLGTKALNQYLGTKAVKSATRVHVKQLQKGMLDLIARRKRTSPQSWLIFQISNLVRESQKRCGGYQN